MFIRQKKDDPHKVDGLDIILFFVALFHHTLQLFIPENAEAYLAHQKKKINL